MQALAAAVALLFAASMPAAAEDRPASPWSELSGPSIADELRPAVPKRRLPVVGLRLRAAPVGLAVELAEGVHVGAAADLDPARDEAVGLIAFRLSL